MNLVTLVLKNADGKIIEKEVEERLTSTYLAIGWKIKGQKEEKIEKDENTFSQPKKIDKYAKF